MLPGRQHSAHSKKNFLKIILKDSKLQLATQNFRSLNVKQDIDQVNWK